MFIRFVTVDILQHLRVEAGVFTAVDSVLCKGDVPDYERDRLSNLLDWFNRELRVPYIFTEYTKSRQKAICWFKPSAKEHIEKIWEMIFILENNGVPIRMITTRKPGYVFYEDDHQIAAEPFAEMRLKV